MFQRRAPAGGALPAAEGTPTVGVAYGGVNPPAPPATPWQVFTDWLQTVKGELFDPTALRIHAIETTLLHLDMVMSDYAATTRDRVVADVLTKATIGPVRTIETYDRNHLLLFCGSNTPRLTFNVVGLGTFTTTLSAGWNIIDLPDKSTVSVDSTDPNNSYNVIWRATDIAYGNPI